MEGRALRPPGLCRNHALGDSRRDADGARLPNHPVEFLRQHPRPRTEMSDLPDKSGFDQYAGDYDGALAQGLSVSGENSEFFARGRIAWLAKILSEKYLSPKTALDFGCGTGQAAPLLK